MKKLISLLLCLALVLPCACAEELPRDIGEDGADYAWLYEKSLIIAERFQYGLDCTWHSFLLSAANVPEQEMLDALAPLRKQDYNQPAGVTFVRADQLLPDEMIEAWQAALKAEEEAKAARAALRSAELVNELAIVKLANAEEEVLKTTEEALKTAEEAFKAAEEAAKLAEETAESLRSQQKRGVSEEAQAAEEAAATAAEIAKAAEEAFKAAEEAAKAVKELEKGEAFLAAKEAAKAAKNANKVVEEAEKAAKEAAKAAAEKAKEEEQPATKGATRAAATPEPEPEKEKTEAELAAEDASFLIADMLIAAEKASKAAEEAFKAEANAIQAAQTLADLKAGKTAEDEDDLDFEDDQEFEDELDREDDSGSEDELDSENDLELEDEPESEDDFELESGDDANLRGAADLEADSDSGSDSDDWDSWDWDMDWDDGFIDTSKADASAAGETDTGWDDWDDWDWDWDYDSSPSSSASSASQQAEKASWFIEDDPDRDLYHSASTILNFHEEDKMFGAISNAIRVTGFYTRDEALEGPCYALIDYGGEYALLITWYPAGEGFISINCQVIYSRSADNLFAPKEAQQETLEK